MKINYRYGINKRLITAFILVGVLPLALSFLLSYYFISAKLTEDAFLRLGTIHQSIDTQLTNFFKERKSDSIILANNALGQDATRDFQMAFDQLNGSSEDEKSKLLRQKYISKNPYKGDERDRYVFTNDRSLYSMTHKKYHPMFRQYLYHYGYYDIFLVNMSGRVLYSVTKEEDFGTNLLTGQYKDQNIAAAFRQARTLAKESVWLEDYQFYTPSNNKPASFIATPIYKNDRMLGVLILQMPIDQIHRIIHTAYFTGDALSIYLVGKDLLLRSAIRMSRRSEENHILKRKIKSEGILRAARSNSLIQGVFTNDQGKRVLGIYQKRRILNLEWIGIYEIDEEKAFASVRNMAIFISVIFGVISFITVITGIILSNAISKPIIQLKNATIEVSKGNLDTKIEILSQDEIGELAHQFNFMTASMEQAHQGLEDLIHVASHDLQTPIVSMVGYTNELLKEYGDGMGEKGIFALTRLRSNAERLHKLVLSLLDISRLNTVKYPPSNFNPNGIIENILRDIDLTIDQYGVKFCIHNLPVIYGDQQRLASVFRNLILNAIHYQGKHITIGFKDGAYYVEDDGAGIPESQLEKIFRPGERLKIVNVEGAGMGLTFCKKVIDRHNGTIWAESKGQNLGSTFYFNVSNEQANLI